MNRSLARKQRGSKNRQKAKLKLQQVHYQIECYRSDFIHKFTSDITKRFDTIWIEDLNVKGMVRNRKLSRAIIDLGWGEAARQLEYKCLHFGKRDRFFPSSQLCSDCGHRQKMPLNEREFRCEKCGSVKDRDHNAALNINTGGFPGINACGDYGSGFCCKTKVKPDR